MSFYQNVRIDTYLAATQTDGRDGDNLSYRGLFDYNADKYGVQAERLVVEPNFLPEIGFVRRTDMRRNFGLLRYSPQAERRAEPAQAHDAGEPELPDQQPEPPRHARRRRPAAKPSSPTAISSASPTPTASSDWSGRLRFRPA